VAVLGDDERVMWHVLAQELGEDSLSDVLMLVFVLGGMLLSSSSR